MAPLTRLVVIVLVVGLLVPGTSHAQADKPGIFNPPIVNIEISGPEPLPPGVADQLRFSGGGGGGTLEITPGPVHWQLTTDFHWIGSSHPPEFGACGYGVNDTTLPVGTLTQPDGKTVNLKIISGDGLFFDPKIDPALHSNDCYMTDQPLQDFVGMPLGVYTVSFKHPKGDLTYQYLVDYPYCRVMTPNISAPSSSTTPYLLAGLLPNEQVTVYIYGNPQGVDYRYLATRHLTADQYGAVVAQITLARSANLSSGIRFVFGGGETSRFPPPSYPTYQFGGIAFNGFGTVCSSPLNAAFTIDGSPVQMRASPAADAAVLATLPQGEIVTIKQIQEPTVAQPVLWRKVQRNNGDMGWIAGNKLTPVQTRLVPGAQGRDAINDIFTAPDDNSQKQPKKGKTVTFVSQVSALDINGQAFWYVQTDQRQTGYVLCDDSCALPTKPVSVDGISVPAGGGSSGGSQAGGGSGGAPNDKGQAGGGSGNALNAPCPNGLASRLQAGMTARSISKDALILNTLPKRPSLHPDSKRLASVSTGEVYTVVDGPQCADDITWWKVTYKGLTGWIGEGDSTGYWSEPVQ